MDVVIGLLIVIHLIGWAIVLGGSLAGLKDVRFSPGILHGALTALVTGIALVGVYEVLDDYSVNHIKVGIKLVATLAVVGLALFANRNRDDVTRPMLGALAGLTALNVVIAVMW